MIPLIEEFRKAINERDVNKIYSILKQANDFNPNYFNWVSDVFEKNEDKTALIWTDIQNREERKFTYRKLSAEANKLLNFLRKEGIKKGDPVYIMTPIIPEQWISLLAVIKGGFIGVPTAVNLTEYELNYRFKDLKPKAIIADEESAKKINVEAVKIVIGKREGWISYEKVLDESSNAEPETTKPSDEILHYFTSGTTGLPKRVIHTAVSYPIGHLSTTSFIGIKSEDIHLNLSAPGWAKFAWSSFFSPFIMNATVLGINYTGKLDPEKYLSLVESFNVNTFCAPPTAWRQFIILDLNKFKFPKLREVVSAGEPLNPEVIKIWENKFNLRIRDFYGQTETTAMIGNFPWDISEAGSMGKPSPMYDIRLLDDDGNEVGKGIVGHIAVKINKRPIGLFKGYSDEEKNKSAFRNEYYYTGDKAYYTDNGWYFVGRADDIIKTSDYRVGPFEVESALLEHPAVAEAAVVGSPDPQRWQIIKAFVVLKEGYKPSYELALELHNHVKKLLMSYKVPRIIEFVPELPKTISGKIRRNELRKLEEERRRKGEKGEYEFSIK
ncbi:acyl--CoA ligase [Saccharolobus caldissimus]|uniref:Acetyl-CoA synthetase n=1 Tax=Saccharolobus caldissimus TaxID=1702097 RepID=A0AAQ4CUX8_9CREN|nr:acyl--CoA ligase [Saccharolobus caldissimus]BDB99609.1 acetyl-CoA synthetase [Saccharolobus caldissimus]